MSGTEISLVRTRQTKRVPSSRRDDWSNLGRDDCTVDLYLDWAPPVGLGVDLFDTSLMCADGTETNK